METEIPAMLRLRETILPERFTYHSSRMRMKKVTAEELALMDKESDRCALELSDARMDVMGYACLVAIMSQGKGYHRISEERLLDEERYDDWLGLLTDDIRYRMPVTAHTGVESPGAIPRSWVSFWPRCSMYSALTREPHGDSRLCPYPGVRRANQAMA